MSCPWLANVAISALERWKKTVLFDTRNSWSAFSLQALFFFYQTSLRLFAVMYLLCKWFKKCILLLTTGIFWVSNFFGVESGIKSLDCKWISNKLPFLLKYALFCKLFSRGFELKISLIFLQFSLQQIPLAFSGKWSTL